MFQKILKFFFKDPYAKEIQKLEPIVEAINREFAELANKTDDQLRQIIIDIKAEVRAKIEPCETELESLIKKYQEEVDEGERDRISNSIDRQRDLLK
ncbi:MAG: hypothetical protein FWG20_05755, partial [Candidatus Cloacimonetes bacterium]|nr:hypothetical protein [Candidatus Cloacimonadota bacterium]